MDAAKEAGEKAAADLQAALDSAGVREQLLGAQLAARDEQLGRLQAEQAEQVGWPGLLSLSLAPRTAWRQRSAASR